MLRSLKQPQHRLVGPVEQSLGGEPLLALEQYPPFPPKLKAMLHRLHGLSSRWSVCPPLVAVSDEVEAHLAEETQILA